MKRVLLALILALLSFTLTAQLEDPAETTTVWEELDVAEDSYYEPIVYYEKPGMNIGAIEILLILAIAGGALIVWRFWKNRRAKGSTPRPTTKAEEAPVEILDYVESPTLPKGFRLKGNRQEYIIKGILGQGSFGITYLAYAENTLVAIKEFYMKDLNGRKGSSVTCSGSNGLYDKYKNKFAKEAQLIQSLCFPGIIKVTDCFAANNTYYYAMEYVEGGSLNEYIEVCDRLPEETAVKYIKEIGKALSYMHRHNIAHLDIKPSNIMISKGGKAVLIDFGLSKQYDDNGIPESSTSIGGGTPGYAPIEQSTYRSSDELPVTMDVYALGATMFKMLTGSRPPEASTILNEGFPREELQRLGITSQTIRSIEKAMAPTKKNRYQTIAAFTSSLGDEERTVI